MVEQEANESSEVEYVASTAAISETIGILGDLKITVKPVIICEGNRDDIVMAKNRYTKRSKHIDIKHHRGHVEAGPLQIESVSTQDQLVDLFTKALDTSRFRDLRRSLGLPRMK